LANKEKVSIEMEIDYDQFKRHLLEKFSFKI